VQLLESMLSSSYREDPTIAYLSTLRAATRWRGCNVYRGSGFVARRLDVCDVF